MSDINKLFIVSGPSGVGKGTLVRQVLARVPDLYLSVSMTTRRPREGEIAGVNYNFITEEDFKKFIEDDSFLEWARVHNKYYYGTPFKPVQNALKQGQSVILEIDVQGAMQVKERVPKSVLIFVVPPSIEVLRERLRERKTESEEDIESRLRTAAYELDHLEKYDYIVVNDILENAVEELIGIIKKETS